jgi:hypothetical protein
MTKYLAGRGTGSLRANGSFSMRGRIDTRLHVQTDASRRFLRLCRILVTPPAHHSLNRFQELPHLGKDLIRSAGAVERTLDPYAIPLPD